MMDKKMLEATYLVDDVYLLNLQENRDGFQYHCFDKRDGSEAGSGLVEWTDMGESPVRGVLACACILATQEIGLEGQKVSSVSQDMLSQFPKGRKLLYQLGKKETNNDRSIRFIDSDYHDLFRIPDGGVIQVTYPDRSFSQKCSFIDEYHCQVGNSVYHICQLAEMLERGGGSCQPEPVVLEEEAAWKLNGKGYLSIQTCEDGYDYTFFDEQFLEIDGGQLDEPELSMNEVRDMLLSEVGWEKRTMVCVDYEKLLEKAEYREQEHQTERKSALGQLSELKGTPYGMENHAPKRREEER